MKTLLLDIFSIKQYSFASMEHENEDLKEDSVKEGLSKDDQYKPLSLLHPEFVRLKTLCENLQTLCEKQKEYIRDLEDENFMSKIQLGCMLLLTCMFILNYKS